MKLNKRTAERYLDQCELLRLLHAELKYLKNLFVHRRNTVMVVRARMLKRLIKKANRALADMRGEVKFGNNDLRLWAEHTKDWDSSYRINVIVLSEIALYKQEKKKKKATFEEAVVFKVPKGVGELRETARRYFHEGCIGGTQFIVRVATRQFGTRVLSAAYTKGQELAKDREKERKPMMRYEEIEAEWSKWWNDTNKKNFRSYKNRAVVYDNGGKTFDRYTIIVNDREMYGASDDPYHPMGIGQYAGDVPKGMTDFSHLGVRVNILKVLPDAVKRYIKYLLTPQI